jgi:hypothetical protein
VESRHYQHPNEFAEDMRLICSNCYRYNPPDSGIVHLARKLQVCLDFHIGFCEIHFVLWNAKKVLGLDSLTFSELRYLFSKTVLTILI